MSQLKTTGCQAINNIFSPEICSSCGDINEGFLCEKCRRSIAEIKNISCNLCGAPFTVNKEPSSTKGNSGGLLSDEVISKKQALKTNPDLNNAGNNDKKKAGCPVCRDSEYSFYRLRSFGIYSGILKELIIKFKYRKIYTLAPVLTGFLKKAYLENYFSETIDYVDTVPDFVDFRSAASDSASQAQNHMQILVKMFSKETGIPYGDNIIKIKKTLKQHNLGLYERKVNLEGVFKAQSVLSACKKNILLIDDVWTTGNTLNGISQALKKCGAKNIYLLTIARAV